MTLLFRKRPCRIHIIHIIHMIHMPPWVSIRGKYGSRSLCQAVGSSASLLTAYCFLPTDKMYATMPQHIIHGR